MKPDKELRKKYHTDYNDRSDFASVARLLQSIWREEKGYNFNFFGNYLDLNFSKESGANYLTKEIFEIVKYEVQNKHSTGKIIKEPRIWNNLLSSQPLAFNAFGELKLNPKLATSIFIDLFPERKIKMVTSIEFEYSPGRKSLKYTGDSSAFDVFLVYENEMSENCFIGIEVKYAENLLDEPARHKNIYEEISTQSEIFDMKMIDKMKEKPIQQIWRDHLLVLSMFIKNKDYRIGDFIYLYPSENYNCQSAIEQYSQIFIKEKENYFHPLTLEKFIDTVKFHCPDNWVKEFENRYLKFEKINKILS